MEKENKTRLKKTSQGYGYKYTDLAQIHEYLEENNISYYQFVETNEKGDDYIMTVPIIEGKEQPARRGVKIVDAVLQGIKNPAQEQGSATTYARRYSLLMAFGLATEDDDGASLTKPKEMETKVEKKEIKLTENQKKVLLKLEEERLTKYLEFYKKENVDELTIQEASAIIQKVKGEQK